MVNRFVLNGISYHGKGAIQEIPGIIQSKGLQKAFIASDPDLIRFGVTAKVTDLLDANHMAYEVYSDIKPNPTIENVKSGLAAYKASGAGTGRYENNNRPGKLGRGAEGFQRYSRQI